jgi:L-threonylcarbamoyladenylate synthase
MGPIQSDFRIYPNIICIEGLNVTMETKYWVVDPHAGHDHPHIIEAGAMIRAGKIVAFPTETVYGLGADATNTEAVENIFKAKGRPSDNPLIVHIYDRAQLADLGVSRNETAAKVMDRFWPGPLTLILPIVKPVVSAKVTAGLNTLAVRLPDHPLAQNIIRASGRPVAAPSANRSGRPSPTRGEHVREDLEGRIHGILDGGATGVGLESTVIEITGNRVHVLRPGGVTAAELRSVSPHIEVIGYTEEDEIPEAPKSPGTKYKHYAPQGELIVVTGSSSKRVIKEIQALARKAKDEGKKTGVLTYEEHAPMYASDLVIACGRLTDLSAAAKELYESLRKFDQEGIECIIAEGCSDEGIGHAVMNRLRKASGNRIVQIP